MYYTYVLKSLKDHKKYIGSTEDLDKRLELHKAGKVTSTKYRRPFELIYFEKFNTRGEVRWRERFFKRSRGTLNKAMLRASEYGHRTRGLMTRREGSVG